MANHLTSASTLVGTGLGGATGLAINRLALGNKSLASNIASTAIGALAGGALGYSLDKYVFSPEHGPVSKLNNALAGATKSADVLKDKEVLKAVLADKRGELDATDGKKLRDKLDALLGTEGRVELYNSADEALGTKDRSLGEIFWDYGAAGATGFGLDKARRWLSNKISKDPVTLNTSDHAVEINPKTGWLSLTREVAGPKGPISIKTDLRSVTPQAARDIANSVVGDRRVKQGLFYRLFGNPIERKQAAWIFRNATGFDKAKAVGKAFLPSIAGMAARGLWDYYDTSSDSDQIDRFRELIGK